MSEVELGKPRVGGALVRVFRMRDGVAFRVFELVGTGTEGPLEDRRVPDGYLVLALGVVLELPVGSFNLLGGFIGVLTAG